MPARTEGGGVRESLCSLQPLPPGLQVCLVPSRPPCLDLLKRWGLRTVLFLLCSLSPAPLGTFKDSGSSACNNSDSNWDLLKGCAEQPAYNNLLCFHGYLDMQELLPHSFNGEQLKIRDLFQEVVSWFTVLKDIPHFLFYEV